MKEIVNGLMKASGEALFLRLSVHDLMWGYHDNFMSVINKMFHVNVQEIFGLFYNVCFLK